MTQEEFDNYKLQIQYIISQKGEALSNYLAIGKTGICNNVVNLELLIAYMEIMHTYDLEEESVSDDNTSNFFTRSEMQNIVTHINKICGTHYNVNFIKET